MVVHGRNRERAEATAREITVAGGKAAVTVGDLELDEDANIVAADALKAFGGIDILVTMPDSRPSGESALDNCSARRPPP